MLLSENFDLHASNIAVSDENGKHVTYKELKSDVDVFSTFLEGKKKLVFLLCSNSYSTIVAYLSCLESTCPVLLLDMKIEKGILNSLIKCYNPNIIISEGNITTRHEQDLKISNKIALLMSTSGTTGSPKLVKLSKDNLLSNADSICDYLKIDTEDTAITSLPFSYSYGLSVVNSYLRAGAKIALSDDSILSKEFWSIIRSENVTSFAGVPYTFEILKKLKYSRFDTSGIRYITQAGGKLSDEIKQYMHDECKAKGQEFIVMYGQTEASPRMSYMPFEMLEDKLASIGVAIPGGELFISDSLGSRVTQPYVEGEICYSGPNVMLGYATNLEELIQDDDVILNLSTGDIGYFDEDGFFFVTGRAKRFVKVFGLRIGLDNVENCLSDCGIEAYSSGRDDLLVIFTEDKNKDLNEISKLVSAKFGLNFNYVKSVYVDSVPRLSSGKVNYKELMEYFDSL